MRKRLISKKFRRYPLYKEINEGKTAKLEIYGNIGTQEQDNHLAGFMILYDDIAFNGIYFATISLYYCCLKAAANLVTFANYQYLSLQSATFEVFPNKYNSIIPPACPILFGIYKGNAASNVTYDEFYACNYAFPIMNCYQKRYFILNSPFYNETEWQTNLPQYHLLLRQFSPMSDNGLITSQTFKITLYCRLKDPIN